MGKQQKLGAQVFKAQQRVRWGPGPIRHKPQHHGQSEPSLPEVTPHFSGSSLCICERRKYSPSEIRSIELGIPCQRVSLEKTLSLPKLHARDQDERSSQASTVAQTAKRLPAVQGIRVRSLGREDPLEKEMATHSSILAWRIPWPGSSVHGEQRVGHG